MEPKSYEELTVLQLVFDEEGEVVPADVLREFEEKTLH